MIVFESCLSVPNDDLDAFILNEMEKGHIPGFSALVVRNTTILWRNSYGLSDPSKNVKVRNDTLFTLASVSKTVISFVVMGLVEQGLIKLDDDISHYIGFELKNPKASGAVTMRHLLSHMSSIDDDGMTSAAYSNSIVEGDSNVPLGKFLKEYLVKGGKYYKSDSWHNWAPGKRFDYSNIGASLAAYAAEFVSNKHTGKKQSFDDLALHMYGLLNITDDGYHVTDVTKPGQAPVAIPSTWKNNKYNVYCLYGYPDYPDGTFRISPLSYSYMFTAFINNGTTTNGVHLLKPGTVKEMSKVQYPGAAGDLPQGLIWYYDDYLQKGKYLLGHNGGDDGMSTDAYFNPNTGVGFIAFANGDDDIKGFSASMKAIEKKLMSTFDKNEKWDEHPPQNHSRHYIRHRNRGNINTKGPCGLPTIA